MHARTYTPRSYYLQRCCLFPLPSSPLLILPSLVTAHCQQRRIRSIWLACCLATVAMATDSLWRQGWDRGNASGNGLMGKCCTVIILAYFFVLCELVHWNWAVWIWSDEVCVLEGWSLDTTRHHYKNHTFSSLMRTFTAIETLMNTCGCRMFYPDNQWASNLRLHIKTDEMHQNSEWLNSSTTIKLSHLWLCLFDFHNQSYRVVFFNIRQNSIPFERHVSGRPRGTQGWID